MARFIFLNPQAREFFGTWEGIASDAVAILRAEAGRNPYDRRLSDLIGELSTRSDEFRIRWAAHNVKFHRTGSQDSSTTLSSATSPSPTKPWNYPPTTASGSSSTPPSPHHPRMTHSSCSPPGPPPHPSQSPTPTRRTDHHLAAATRGGPESSNSTSAVTARTVPGMAHVRSGQAPAWPLAFDRSVRSGLPVKRLRVMTGALPPVLVALRAKSRLGLEGRHVHSADHPRTRVEPGSCPGQYCLRGCPATADAMGRGTCHGTTGRENPVQSALLVRSAASSVQVMLSVRGSRPPRNA